MLLVWSIARENDVASPADSKNEHCGLFSSL